MKVPSELYSGDAATVTWRLAKDESHFEMSVEDTKRRQFDIRFPASAVDEMIAQLANIRDRLDRRDGRTPDTPDETAH